jgi:hypothetical protein
VLCFCFVFLRLVCNTGADPPLKKIWFFGVKSWFFTRNTPKMFAPPSARRNFFKCALLTWNPGSAPAICCPFLWIVHFWLSLRYSLTFIIWSRLRRSYYYIILIFTYNVQTVFQMILAILFNSFGLLAPKKVSVILLSILSILSVHSENCSRNPSWALNRGYEV